MIITNTIIFKLVAHCSNITFFLLLNIIMNIKHHHYHHLSLSIKIMRQQRKDIDNIL